MTLAADLKPDKEVMTLVPELTILNVKTLDPYAELLSSLINSGLFIF
jgi:hypothetical protein